MNYRPPGKAHYGGIVERVIGTFMQQVHNLPGTTFSNPTQKGDYNSEKNAVLTMNELERWLALAVSHYHGSLHQGLKQTPLATWEEGVSRIGKLHIIHQPHAFLIDFLPVLRRKIGRCGFLIDHIAYYSDALKSWIANRAKLDKFIIRRNPLDLSRIWVLSPDKKQYLEVPYRILSRPGLTLWEHKQAMLQLREKGRKQIDESLLFETIKQMRKITQLATVSTRKAKRNEQRLAQIKHLPLLPQKTDEEIAAPADSNLPSAKPFEQIEEW